jgi:hypothetical protein
VPAAKERAFVRRMGWSGREERRRVVEGFERSK